MISAIAISAILAIAGHSQALAVGRSARLFLSFRSAFEVWAVRRSRHRRRPKRRRCREPGSSLEPNRARSPPSGPSINDARKTYGIFDLPPPLFFEILLRKFGAFLTPNLICVDVIHGNPLPSCRCRGHPSAQAAERASERATTKLPFPH